MNGVDVSDLTKGKVVRFFGQRCLLKQGTCIITDWIYKHPNVIHSSLRDDPLLVPDPTRINQKEDQKSKVIITGASQ